jgi:hypothetical protein
MWELEKTGTKNDCKIFGVQIFDFKWDETGQIASVRDPVNDSELVMPVYNVCIDGKTLTFAAGELKDGEYGFYLWSKEERKSKKGKKLKLSHIIALLIGAIAFAFFITIVIAIALGFSFEAETGFLPFG